MTVALTRKMIAERFTEHLATSAEPASDGDPLLIIDGLEAGYERPVVGPLSLVIAPGEVVALWGPNGVGKTTLLNAMTGMGHVFAGTVKRRSQLLVSHHPQNSPPLNNVPLSGRELLALTGADLTGLPASIRPLLSRRLSELSGGQLQILQVWASLAAPVDLVLLDEPTNNLDPDTVALLETTIRARPEDRAIIIVSHDRRFVDAVATRVIELVRL